MASRSTKRILTVCGVGLYMCRILHEASLPQETVQPFQLSALKVFNQQKDPLTRRDAQGIRQSVQSRFAEKDLPFSYLETELKDIMEKVNSGKKEKISDMLYELQELKKNLPERFTL